GTAQQPQQPIDLDQVRFGTVTVRKERLSVVLRKVTQQTGLELKINQAVLRRAGISLDQRVSVDLTNVSVDELLKALLSQAGLTFQREGKVVTVRPADREGTPARE
ncbi:MAG: STN domain-containing protein, partial [Pirellulales bacterium]|nr:STN domain-containing protein [Pirellulales bacterium]